MNQNGSEHSEKFEFTPIGYMREKRNGGTIPMKRVNETAENENANTIKKIRSNSIDDSLNSMQMFNDTSQFDDTLPQLNLKRTNNVNNKRNLIDDLKDNAQTSNPLKEQQEQMHRLTTDNYNLRLKCNSLLKFLNNVTDEGELKKSLNLLEEIQDWKQKYQLLNDEYGELKRSYDELEIKTTTIGSVEHENHGSDHLEQELQDKLAETESKLKMAQDEVRRLEQLHLNSNDTKLLEEQQHKLQIDVLKSNVNQLNLQLREKEEDLEEQKGKVYRLTNQLQEFDHNGSESLLRLESQLEQKNTSIRGLEKELVNLTHNRQSLESQLKILEKKYNELNTKYKEYDVERQKNAIIEKTEEIRKLKEEKKLLNESITELKMNYESLRIQIRENGENSQAMRPLQVELRETKQKLDEARRLSQELQNQIIENATKNTERISERVRKKDSEIEDLKMQLKSKDDQHEKIIRSKIQDMIMENDIAKNKLTRQISLLHEELSSAKDSYEREVTIWRDKCKSLSRESDRMIALEQETMEKLRRQLSSKTEEVENLNRAIERSKIDQLEMNERLVRLQNSKDSYKEELKKISTKLEYLSKEYIKSREKNSNFVHTDKDEHQSLKEKYNTMKQKLLDELKSLQDENLSLERRLLESRNHSQTQGHPPRSNSANQDRIDYYKLKYNTEVKQNNDLRVMNIYLNRVLKASSQHVRLDLLKIRNEVTSPDPTSYKSEYQTSGIAFDRRRLKFKTVALFVLSCVRMRQVAIRHKWDEQRLRYLQRKITIDDDRISW